MLVCYGYLTQLIAQQGLTEFSRHKNNSPHIRCGMFMYIYLVRAASNFSASSLLIWSWCLQFGRKTVPMLSHLSLRYPKICKTWHNNIKTSSVKRHYCFLLISMEHFVLMIELKHFISISITATIQANGLQYQQTREVGVRTRHSTKISLWEVACLCNASPT